MKLFRKKRKNNLDECTFYSPLDGELISLSEVADEVFAQEMLGTGFAIIPSNDILYMPIKGEITMLFPTKHALSLKDTLGNEYILHIGIDSVHLQGKNFESYVKVGQTVDAGQPLIKFPLNDFRKHQINPTVMIIKTNPRDQEFVLNKHRKVKVLDELIKL